MLRLRRSYSELQQSIAAIPQHLWLVQGGGFGLLGVTIGGKPQLVVELLEMRVGQEGRVGLDEVLKPLH